MLEINKLLLKKHVFLKHISADEEHYIMLDCNSGKEYELTEFEFLILQSTVDGIQYSKLLNIVFAMYDDIPKEEIAKDIDEYVTELVKESLLAFDS